MFLKKRVSQVVTGDVENVYLLESLLTNFTSVYGIDFENRTLKAYKQDDMSRKRFSMFSNGFCSYDEAMNYYVENEVHTEDKDVFRDFVQLDKVRDLLSRGKSPSFDYKVVYKGNLYYARVRFVNYVNDSNNNRAILVFRNITDEVIKRQNVQQEFYEQERIIEMLSNEYESIYQVNITEQTFKTIRYPEYLKKFGESFNRGHSVFSILEKYVKEFVHPDDVEKMLELTNVSKVREALRGKNSFVVTFRDTAAGKLQHLELRVFRMFTGRDFTVIAGFINRDAEKFLEVESEDIVRKAMICNLGEDYDCIASIDFENNTAKIAHCSPAFKKYCDDVSDVKDYDSLYKKLSELFVIPSERELYYQQCSKDAIIQGLKDKISYYVSYKVNIDGKEYPYQAKFTYDRTEIGKIIVGFHKIL